MNFIDLLIIIPLIYAGYKGFKHGLIIEVFTLLAFVVGIYAGNHLSDAAALMLRENLNMTSKYLPIISFTIIFLIVGAGVYFAGKALEQMIKIVNLTPVNKFFGIFFALVKMLYILSVILVIFDGYDEKSHFFEPDTKAKSLLYQPVRNLSTTTIPGLDNSLVFLKNDLKNETDSTGLTIEQVLRAKEIADSLGLDANDAKAILEIHEKYEKK
jgi:membrane protein required for colicin V production